MKWGIYQVADRNVSVEQMCDRALLAARSIKGRYGTYFAAYDDQLRNRLLREQAITDSMEPALAKKQFEVCLLYTSCLGLAQGRLCRSCYDGNRRKVGDEHGQDVLEAEGDGFGDWHPSLQFVYVVDTAIGIAVHDWFPL